MTCPHQKLLSECMARLSDDPELGPQLRGYDLHLVLAKPERNLVAAVAGIARDCDHGPQGMEIRTSWALYNALSQLVASAPWLGPELHRMVLAVLGGSAPRAH